MQDLGTIVFIVFGRAWILINVRCTVLIYTNVFIILLQEVAYPPLDL